MQSIWVSRRVLCECSSIRARMHRGHVPGHKDLSWRGSGHEVVGLKFGAAFSNHSMCSFVSAVSRRRGLIITPTVPAQDRPVVIVICAAGHNGPDFFVEVLYPLGPPYPNPLPSGCGCDGRADLLLYDARVQLRMQEYEYPTCLMEVLASRPNYASVVSLSKKTVAKLHDLAGEAALFEFDFEAVLVLCQQHLSIGVDPRSENGGVSTFAATNCEIAFTAAFVASCTELNSAFWSPQYRVRGSQT